MRFCEGWHTWSITLIGRGPIPSKTLHDHQFLGHTIPQLSGGCSLLELSADYKKKQLELWPPTTTTTTTATTATTATETAGRRSTIVVYSLQQTMAKQHPQKKNNREKNARKPSSKIQSPKTCYLKLPFWASVKIFFYAVHNLKESSRPPYLRQSTSPDS